jgi:phosphatidylglycerol phospholipase C
MLFLDVHVSRDGVVVMFHDPDLSRTTDSTGLIRERDWNGEDGMHKVRTVKEPKQTIPTFAETVALLMLPENRHVKFNVGTFYLPGTCSQTRTGRCQSGK